MLPSHLGQDKHGAEQLFPGGGTGQPYAVGYHCGVLWVEGMTEGTGLSSSCMRAVRTPSGLAKAWGVP